MACTDCAAHLEGNEESEEKVIFCSCCENHVTLTRHIESILLALPRKKPADQSTVDISPELASSIIDLASMVSDWEPTDEIKTIYRTVHEKTGR